MIILFGFYHATSIRFRQQFFQVRQRSRHDLALRFDAGDDLGRGAGVGLGYRVGVHGFQVEHGGIYGGRFGEGIAGRLLPGLDLLFDRFDRS